MKTNNDLENSEDKDGEFLDEKNTEDGFEVEQELDKVDSLVWMQKLFYILDTEEYHSKSKEEVEVSLEDGRDEIECLITDKSSGIEKFVPEKVAI